MVRLPSRPAALRTLLGVAALGAFLAGPAWGQFAGHARLPVTARAIWDDTTYVDAVIRLDFESGPSAVIPALTYDTTLLLPLRQFAEMAELRVAALALHDSALIVLEPGHVPLRFRPSTHELQRGSEMIPYDTLNIVWWDGDLFVSTRLLDQLLGINTLVDWPSLSVVVGHTMGLPVVQRERRERRRVLIASRRPPPEALDLALRQRVVDGAVASWSLTAAETGPTNQVALDLGFGAGLAGGSAELRPVFWSSNGASSSDLRWSWTRIWSGMGGLSQLRVGDIQSYGLRSRLVEGVAITNAPFIRSSEFDVEQFVTNVPAGWEAELYEGGRLLAYADADAVGAFRVPLQLGYGQNPFDVVLYGPGGETVRQARTIRVPFSRLPSRHFEYAVAGGRCRYDPCNGLLSADARYGVSSRMTLQGGWDTFFRGTSGALWQPYAVVAGAPLPSLGLTGEAVGNGHVRGSANYEPSLDLRLTGAYTHFTPSSNLSGGALSEAGRSEATAYWRPGWMRGAAFLQGAGIYSTGPAMQRSLTRLSGTTRYGRFRYSLGVLHDALERTGAAPARHLSFDAGADAVLNGPWRWLRASAVQGQVAMEPTRGLTAIRTNLGRSLSRGLRMDAGLGWLRGSGLNIELALSTATQGPRFGARSRASAEGGSQALFYTSGSVAVDPRTQLMRLSDVADLGRAGISGVLFRDDNDNGVQDPGEPGLPGIPVRVGGWPAETDAQGRFAAWGMYPSEPLQIEVDTLSLGNPQWMLPAPVLRVRPAPNAFGAVAVPVVVGGEVGGFVVLGEEALPNVPVVLRELNTGVEITIVTYSDGGFYKGAVPPGEYEVTLPDAMLDRLHADAPPLSIFIPPGAGEKRYLDLNLRLQPRP
jgi:hypothetical protein